MDMRNLAISLFQMDQLECTDLNFNINSIIMERQQFSPLSSFTRSLTRLLSRLKLFSTPLKMILWGLTLGRFLRINLLCNYLISIKNR